MTRHQTATDHETLCVDHSRFTDQVGDAVIAIQDAAFELGVKRGLEEGKAIRKELLEFAEEVRRTGDARLASMAIVLINKVNGGQP